VHKKILIEIIALTMVFIILSCDWINKKAADFVDSALTDTTYIVKIPQKIGGTLICNAYYFDDFHSWNFDIEYNYENIYNSVSYIGNGRYAGREWEKDEQLVKFRNWLILKTADHRNDKLIIGDLKSNKWTEYELSPKVIEEDNLWINSNINSSPDYYDSFTRIESVDSTGEFLILYKYAIKNRIFSFMEGKRMIKFRVNSISGKPEMIKILNK
jgi:hypothetical protein